MQENKEIFIQAYAHGFQRPKLGSLWWPSESVWGHRLLFQKKRARKQAHA